MSKEIILKYLTEFNAWVKGQEVYVMFNNGGHRLVDSLEDFNKDVKYIVLRDSYFPYRTALAEGKTVEVYILHGIKVLDEQPWKRFAIGCSTFDLPVECYRIKPEEPKFKVGDWIRQGTRVFQYSYKDLQYDKANPTHCQNDEKWEPRGGEVCILWDNKHTNEAIIARYSHSERSFYYPLKKPNSCYQNCMPFTGILPPHMKDN